MNKMDVYERDEYIRGNFRGDALSLIPKATEFLRILHDDGVEIELRIRVRSRERPDPQSEGIFQYMEGVFLGGISCLIFKLAKLLHVLYEEGVEIELNIGMCIK